MAHRPTRRSCCRLLQQHAHDHPPSVAPPLSIRTTTPVFRLDLFERRRQTSVMTTRLPSTPPLPPTPFSGPLVYRFPAFHAHLSWPWLATSVSSDSQRQCALKLVVLVLSSSPSHVVRLPHDRGRAHQLHHCLLRRDWRWQGHHGMYSPAFPHSTHTHLKSSSPPSLC